MKADLLILVNEKMIDAELALSEATSETIVGQCKDYLAKLSEYRDRLYELHGAQELSTKQNSAVVRELILQVRKAILTALQINVKNTNEVTALLKSFTMISGYEAADIFNQYKYEGFSNWELRPGGLRPIGRPDNEAMKVEAAVEKAGLLRRDSYIAGKTEAKQVSAAA